MPWCPRWWPRSRGAAPAGILARHDPKVRLLEGLEQHVKELAGSVPHSVGVREGPVEYDVDLWSGQKTGLFLDQRENREAAARYARGRLLDCFSYNGGFALRLAPRCASAEAVDISSDAVVRIRANAESNGIGGSRCAKPTCSTSCGAWSAPASTTTRSCWTPRRLRRTRRRSPARRRLQGDQPPGDAPAEPRRPSGHLQLLL